MEISSGIIICCFIFICNMFEYKISVCAQSDSSGGDLNSPCSAVKGCKSFGYVCRENTCQCDQWYVPDKERKKCVGGVDQKCLYDEHCIEGAYCMNQSICKCKQSSSQPFDHGLVCAGVADLKQLQSIRLTFLAIGILISIFSRACT